MSALITIRLARRFPTRPPVIRHFGSWVTRRPHTRYLACSVATVAVVSYLVYPPKQIHLDSLQEQRHGEGETEIDPATTITFPKVMHIPSNIGVPPLTLVGLGVRTVSFLGIKVYSVAFYADLNNPNLKIPVDMPGEEKIKHIVRNSSCIIRIVPTRSTSYTHLRDAFLRALQSRLSAAVREGAIQEDVVPEISSSLRKLKGLFPNSNLAKHTPLDIYLSAPTADKQRVLVFRDLGSVENDWVATEFVLHYFEGTGPSPRLKNSVLETLVPYSMGDSNKIQSIRRLQDL